MKHFDEFAHPSLKSPVSDDDDNLDKSSGKMESPPSGGRQKRAAALKQKGVTMQWFFTLCCSGNCHSFIIDVLHSVL